MKYYVDIEDGNGPQEIQVNDYEYEPDLPAEIRLRGVLKALRYMLRVPESESIFYRCATVMRRYDALRKRPGFVDFADEKES